MGPEKRSAAIFENVECRSRPGIDFDQRVFVAFDEKIDAVETAEPARRRYGFRRAPQTGFPALGRQTSRAKAAAETKGFPRCRRRPLTAQSHDLRLGSIAKKQDRNRLARGDALEVNLLAFRAKRPSRRDMASARSTRAFDKPMPAVRRDSRADLRMRNAQGGAKLRQSHRILHAAHHLWRVAKERPALRNKFQEFGAVLEPGAIDEAARRHLLGKLFKRADEALRPQIRCQDRPR